MVNADKGLTRRITRLMLCATVVAGLSACGNGSTTPPSTESTPPITQLDPSRAEVVALTLKGQTFQLETALDDDDRTQGLSDRQSIAEDGGMIFVFPYPRPTQFVMRRCYVPIDLIFVDEDGYIDSLHAMEVIEPIGSPRWKNPFGGYPTAGSVLYAIELKGGKIAELGLRRGEKIDLPQGVLQLKAQ